MKWLVRMKKAGFLLVNGLIFLWVVLAAGCTWKSFFKYICSCLLLLIGIEDEKRFEIPLSYNLLIGGLGVVHLIWDFSNWMDYVTGMCAVSGVLLFWYYLTKGKGIGGGDIKLMAAAGLLLGWQKIILAFYVGAVLGAVVHPARMKFKGKGRIMALGPYLSFGIFISMLYGEKLIAWYLNK